MLCKWEKWIPYPFLKTILLFSFPWTWDVRMVVRNRRDEKQYYERCGQQKVTWTIVAFLLCCLLESTCLATVIGAKAFKAPETESIIASSNKWSIPRITTVFRQPPRTKIKQPDKELICAIPKFSMKLSMFPRHPSQNPKIQHTEL